LALEERVVLLLGDAVVPLAHEPGEGRQRTRQLGGVRVEVEVRVRVRVRSKVRESKGEGVHPS